MSVSIGTVQEIQSKLKVQNLGWKVQPREPQEQRLDAEKMSTGCAASQFSTSHLENVSASTFSFFPRYQRRAKLTHLSIVVHGKVQVVNSSSSHTTCDIVSWPMWCVTLTRWSPRTELAQVSPQKFMLFSTFLHLFNRFLTLNLWFGEASRYH